jgi:transposase
MPLLDSAPKVKGKRIKPIVVQADRAYDCQRYRDQLKKKCICPQLAQRRTEHGSGLGLTRWVVERTIAWLHQFRRLRTRYERRDDIHEGFLRLACAMICWRNLRRYLRNPFPFC